MGYEICDCHDILNDLREGVYFVDADRGITFWNQGAEQITGFTAKEMVGRFCYDNLLNHVDSNGVQLCLNGCPLQATIQDGVCRDTQVFLHHKDGHRVRVNIRVRPMEQNGKVIGAVEIFSESGLEEVADLTVQQLERLALYDQLTELPNRRYIDTYLDHQLSDFRELGIPFGVTMMDLDFFKRINDEYGHSAGDAILRMVSKTLQSALRKNDFVGRWGGEEFIAILRGVNTEELNAIAEKLRVVTGKSELLWEDTPIRVTISIGATMVLKGDNASSLIQRADEALYQSKNDGRNRVTLSRR